MKKQREDACRSKSLLMAAARAVWNGMPKPRIAMLRGKGKVVRKSTQQFGAGQFVLPLYFRNYISMLVDGFDPASTQPHPHHVVAEVTRPVNELENCVA